LGSVGGTTNSIYNNYIYDIKAPASTGTPGTRALHFGGGTTANVYFNTVYIDYTSTIASNQSAALYVTTSPTTLNLNNNIFVNNCDMTTGTRAVAFYKSTTSLANLPNSNNNNLFYAGTPGAKNLIFYNTTPYPTLAEFQTLVTPRENLSVTENPPFNSVSAPYDLHVPNTSTTVAESGGINISGINDDWDGDIRQGSPGYAGTGVSPDIGADEFDGTNPNLASIDMGATALVSPVASGCYTAAETVTVTIKNWGTQLIDFSVNNVTVSTDVNGAVTQSLTATLSSGTLAAGATVNVDMSTTLDMTTAGTYTFNAYTTVTGDGNAANDAMAPVNRTVVASTPLPYIQNFDAGTSSPPGWITTGWTIGTTHANPSTGNGLYKNIWSSAPSGQFTLLKLGPVTATDNLKFDYRIVNYTSYPTTATPNIPAWGNIVINISSDCGMTFSPFATIDPTNHIESTSWATLSFSLAGLAGFDIIIQVAASWSAGDYYVDFDNFEIQTPPACLAPTLQTVANHTTTGADLGWTDATGTHWDLYIVPKDDPAPDGSTTPTVNNTTSNPYTWSGGSENNNYDWYVRSDCDPGNNNTNVSSWAGPNTFSTLCNPISTFPFTENFNGVTVPNLPNCFFQNNANGDGDKWITYTTYGVGGTICAGLYTDYNSGANDDYLILPRLTLSGNQLLKFSVRARSSSEPNDYRVVLSTTGNSPANFTTELMPLTVVSTTIMTEIAPIDLTAYTGNVWIAIHVPPGGLDGYYLYVDDIIVEDIPTCPAPSALTATNITTTSAVLGWTPGGTEQMWSVEVGAPGFTPGTNTSILSEYYTTDNPWTASPLVASTDYEFYVQAYCNGFENPKVDYFWMAMDAPGNLLVPLSGGTADDIDETGEWYQYFDPEEELPWWNIWFYNDPLDEERMKKVRIGFWVNSFDGILDGELNYVINWSTPEWSLLDPPPATPFPMPTDELYIQRSPLNGPIMIRPGIPQWIELLYIIPDYNPEWISVDIWGANIFIEEFPMSPPPGSPLLEWWDPLMPGGIIVHECLPKGHNTSSWSGPKAFSTLCGAFPVPYTENFDGVVTPAIPNCMTVTNDNGDGVTWLTSSLYARSAPNSMYIGFNGSLDMDDWFFTPALTLAPGVYNVSFWYRNSGITYPEKLEVKWGSAPNVTGMTQGPIFNNNNIINSTYAEGSGVITISTAGDYYVGWHGYSDMDMWYLCVDDISVTRKLDHDVATLSVNDPPAVYDPTPIIPKALVKNLGTNTETFSVTMTITGGYTSTKNVTSLAPDASVVVPFDLWTPVVGNYSVQTCTNLGTDEDNSNDCLSKTVDVFDYTRFYCYVAFPGTSSLPEGPAYFYREAPGTINSIAPTTTEFIAAGTWANGIWYASEYYDNTVIPATGGGWYTIDPTTGVMTLLASLGRSFNGITYDLTNQVMYGIDYDGTALTNNLYSIIPSTGVATLIGTIGPGEVLINLATDGAGYLYALGISTDHLFKINPVGPVLTDVGATGVALSYAQDMEYDHETNTMFAAGYTSTGSLYSVNLTSGACTFIGAFAGGAEITGLAIPYCVTMNQWTGNYSTAWNDARNWTCGVVPGASDKVFISSAPSGNRFPVVANGVTAVCYDVTIQPGAIMTVETGGTLNVLNP
jgi:archaellum component FlaG (FlaF/FlaG flagellin family)